MSALLKANDARAQAAVQPLGAPAKEVVFSSAYATPASAPVAGEPAPELVDERTELRDTIDGLRERLADAESDADRREDAAFERGRREGEDLATGEAEKRLELLRQGLAAMQQAHADRLVEYELLTLQVARAALKRVIGDDTLHAELIAATVAQRLSTIKRDLVRRVRVSPRDFRSDDELQALASGLSGVTIEQDDTLDAGACLLDLRLGSIDLGLPGQWSKLTALFEDLAGEGPAS